MGLSLRVCLLFLSVLISAILVNGQRFGRNGANDLWTKQHKNITCNTKSEHRMDRLIEKLIGRRFPTTPIELRQFCIESTRYIDYIIGYVKSCMDEFGKKVAQVMFYPVYNEFQVVCKSGRLSNKARELITAAVCGNAIRPALRRCYYNFNDMLLAVSEVPEPGKRIPTGCCHFNVLRECLKSEAEEEKTCTRHSIDWVERYAIETFAGVLQLLCTEYMDGSDRCDKLVAQTPILNMTGVRKPKSFIIPMIRIMDSLKEVEH